MHECCICGQICQCKREQNQFEGLPKNAAAGHPCPVRGHAFQDANTATIQPKPVTVFVNNENFCWDFPCQKPFPAGHDGFIRADDSNHVIVIFLESFYQMISRLRSLVIVGQIDGSAFLLRNIEGKAVIAGDDVRMGCAIMAVQSTKPFLQNSPGTTFNQKDAAWVWTLSRKKTLQASSLALLPGFSEKGKEQ